MLNMRKSRSFKYDLTNIMEGSDTEDKQIDSFMATVMMKASKNSIIDAIEYLDEKCEEGLIDEDTTKKIKNLLKSYTKRR